MRSSLQLSTYDVAKQSLRRYMGMADGVPCHLAASLLTGVAVVLAMQPFDFAATRLMNQPTAASGKGLLYSGTLDVLMKTTRQEGLLGIYQGALASYLRFGACGRWFRRAVCWSVDAHCTPCQSC